MVERRSLSSPFAKNDVACFFRFPFADAFSALSVKIVFVSAPAQSLPHPVRCNHTHNCSLKCGPSGVLPSLTTLARSFAASPRISTPSLLVVFPRAVEWLPSEHTPVAEESAASVIAAPTYVAKNSACCPCPLSTSSR